MDLPIINGYFKTEGNWAVKYRGVFSDNRLSGLINASSYGFNVETDFYAVKDKQNKNDSLR